MGYSDAAREIEKLNEVLVRMRIENLRLVSIVNEARGIITNAWDGDWSKAAPEWRQAAEHWGSCSMLPQVR